MAIVTIDVARIKDAVKWDGLHAILIHGADNLDALDVIARYHQLWEIEANFRTNKHDLKCDLTEDNGLPGGSRERNATYPDRRPKYNRKS